jgi:hypothetical protein
MPVFTLDELSRRYGERLAREAQTRKAKAEAEKPRKARGVLDRGMVKR